MQSMGVVLGQPGFAWENEEGEKALGLDGEKVFSPAKMIRERSSFSKERDISTTKNGTTLR